MEQRYVFVYWTGSGKDKEDPYIKQVMELYKNDTVSLEELLNGMWKLGYKYITHFVGTSCHQVVFRKLKIH